MNNKLDRVLLATALLAGGGLAGCGGSSISESDELATADYRATTLYDENRLVRPPNILTDIEQVLLQTDQGGVTRLLPDIVQARIRGEGTLRWLEVDLQAVDVWQAARDFWLDQGFALDIELPEAGILETDWQQDRTQVLGTGLTRYLDIALERINDTGIRHRFRTLVEPASRPGTTNVYIAFRGIKQERDGAFVPLEADPTREAEMLRRLLLSFRLPEESIATLEQFEQQAVVNDLYEASSNTLLIRRDLSQSWRRLQLALDRGGFTVSDSNIDTGTIVLLLAAPSEEADPGFFDWLLNTDDEGNPPYEVTLQVRTDGPDATTVTAPADEEGLLIINRIASHL